MVPFSPSFFSYSILMLVIPIGKPQIEGRGHKSQLIKFIPIVLKPLGT